MLAINSMVFLAVTSLLSAILFVFSTWQAQSKEVDTLRSNAHRRASYRAFGALITFPVLALMVAIASLSIQAYSFLTSVLSFLTFGYLKLAQTDQSDLVYLTIDAIGALLLSVVVIDWARHELVAHGKEKNFKEAGTSLFEKQLERMFIYLATHSKERHSMDELYLRSCFWLQTPGAALRTIAEGVMGPTQERAPTSDTNLREFFSTLAADKPKFAKRLVEEAKERRVTAFASREGGSALAPSGLLDWPKTPERYLQYGNHDDRGLWSRLRDR